MSSDTAFRQRRLGGRRSGCQVDGLSNLSVPGFSARAGCGVLSYLSKKDGTAMEQACSVGSHPPFSARLDFAALGPGAAEVRVRFDPQRRVRDLVLLKNLRPTTKADNPGLFVSQRTLHLHLAIIRVISSCCSWELNRRSSSIIASSNSCEETSRCRCNASIRRCSPNSSPKLSKHSVTPEPARVENRRMLDRRRDVRILAVRKVNTLQGMVVGLLAPLVNTISSGEQRSNAATWFRARSTASCAASPAQCWLDGLPNGSDSIFPIAAATSGASGVVPLKSR
jgi:hypothetical protein